MVSYADNEIDARMGSVPMGSPMDPMDHDAYGGHNDAFDKGRAVMASDSLPNPFDEVGEKSKPSKRKPKPIQPTPVPPNRY